jgi:hypothetical protein
MMTIAVRTCLLIELNTKWKRKNRYDAKRWTREKEMQEKVGSYEATIEVK